MLVKFVLTSQNMVIGIAVGMFLVGLAFGYVAFAGSTHSGNMMISNQQAMMNNPQFNEQIMNQILENPEIRNQMMESITQDPEAMRIWMQNTQHAEEMGIMMRDNHDFAMQMMYTIIEDPVIRLQMLGPMTENQEAMQQMMGMMGTDMMMNQEMMNRMMSPDTISNPSTVIPSNAEPQVRSFDIELGEVEFFANTENEEGVEYAVFVELHRWSPNTIVVNKGDTVVLKVTNPRGNYHSFSIPEFGVSTSMLDPRGGTETVEFVADKTGTFTFSCEVPYHPDNQWCDPDHAMMTGTLIVLDSGE